MDGPGEVVTVIDDQIDGSCRRSISVHPRKADKAGRCKHVMQALFFLAFVLFLRPEVNKPLGYFGIVDFVPDRIRNVVILLVFAACLIVYLVRRRPDAFFLLTMASLIWILAATELNGGEFKRIWIDWLPVFATAFLVGAFVRTNYLELLRAMYGACMFYLVISLVGIVIDGNIGFQTQVFMFLGSRTQAFRMAVPAITCVFLLDVVHGRRFSLLSVLTCLLVLFELVVGYSAAALVAVICLIALRIAIEVPAARPKLNIATYAFLDIVGFFTFVVFRVQNKFAWLIEGVLRRSVTFSGRAAIWDAVFSLLTNKHLIFGYGASHIWNEIVVNGDAAMHAHNDVLNMLMTGGVILAVLVAGLFVLAARNLFRYRSSECGAMLAAGLFCFMIIGIVEPTHCAGSFFLLAMSCDVGSLVRGCSEKGKPQHRSV